MSRRSRFLEDPQSGAIILDDLRSLIGDWKAHAHELRGLAGSYGMPPVDETMAEADSFEQAAEQLEEIVEYWQNI